MRTAITSANVNQAKGSFDGPLRASTIDANDQLRTADEYRNLIIAFRNGAPVRLAEVAEIAAVVINMNVWTRLKLAQGATPSLASSGTPTQHRSLVSDADRSRGPQ